MIQTSLLAALRRILLIALLLPLVAASAPLPFSQQYEQPALSHARVSPDGTKVALRAEIEGVQYLALMDALTLQIELHAKFDVTKLDEFVWMGDKLLLMIVANSTGLRDIRSFDVETKQTAFLSEKLKFPGIRILSLRTDHPDEAIIQVSTADGAFLGRLNVRNGSLNLLENTSTAVERWFVDRSGTPIAATGTEGNRRFLQWRATPSSRWQRHDLGTVGHGGIEPWVFHPDQKRLLALDRTADGPASLIALVPATMEKEVLFRPPVEIDEIHFKSGDVTAACGVLYEDDQPRFHFFDPEAAALQAALDKALPNRFNEVVSSSTDFTVFTILSSSESDPGQNYLFSRRTGKLVPYGPAYPAIDPNAMGTSRPFRFQTADGLVVHGRLLLPPGNPPKPPVLVRVGPGLAGPRSAYAFAVKDQIFATRGYAVARIDYRGTYGYGRRFVEAGDCQYGAGMVDDVVAGIDHLASQGWIDPQRVGLFTSYRGGVMGLQALAGSDRFKVWINEETRLADNIDFEDLDFTEAENPSVVEKLGGKAEANKVLEALQPKNVLRKVRIPSFHLYARYNKAVSKDAKLVVSTIKAPAPEVVNYEPPEKPSAPRTEEFNARKRMFAFLDRCLKDSDAQR